MKILILVFLLFHTGFLFAQEDKNNWNITGLETAIYTYVREDIKETEYDEALPGGNIAFGLKTQMFSFKPDRALGHWISVDFRIPFRAIVEGEVEVVDALPGSIQMLGNINFGLGFRSYNKGFLSFYGGLGLHTYLSYLHAFTILSTSVSEDDLEIEILQYDSAFGLGAEIGLRLNTKGKIFFVIGSGFSWDFYSYQNSRVLVEFDPPVDIETIGSVPNYTAFDMSPHVSIGIEY